MVEEGKVLTVKLIEVSGGFREVTFEVNRKFVVIV